VARTKRLRAQYKKNQAAAKTDFPVVCVTEPARAFYAPNSPQIDSMMLGVFNELLKQMKVTGHYPQGTSFPAAQENVDGRLTSFQKANNIDDALGCVGPGTWRKLMSTCPYPMSITLCHEARACVLAIQILMYRWLPEGKRTGRFCKQMQLQTQKFQRRTESFPMDGATLYPSGAINEVDLITLIRRHGIRAKRGHKPVVPKVQKWKDDDDPPP